MQLTPDWKKKIISFIVENIFDGFSVKKFNEELHGIIQTLNMMHSEPEGIGIAYKAQHYIPYSLDGKKVVLHNMSENSPMYLKFITLLDKRDAYNKHTKAVTNYITNGLVLCVIHTDLEHLFPQVILDGINKVHYEQGINAPYLNSYSGTTNPRFVAFRKKYEHIENELAKQLFRKILKPGN